MVTYCDHEDELDPGCAGSARDACGIITAVRCKRCNTICGLKPQIASNAYLSNSLTAR